MQHAFIEAFDSKPRRACRDAHWLPRLHDGRENLEARRRGNDEAGSHSGISAECVTFWR
jgi:hypothetical protein